MASLEDLVVRILGDTTGLKSAVAESNAELSSLGTTSAGATGTLEKDATGAAGGVTMLGGAAKDAEKETGNLETGLKNASKEMGGLEKAAGGGASGIMGMVTGMTGLPAPALAVGVAVGATVLIADKAAETYNNVKQQIDQLTVALKDHGESYDELSPKIEQTIKDNEQYGYGADETRASITKMTEAGISFSDIQAGLPAIMDLARAKNISLSDATEVYTKAMMGSAKGLKDLGIILPSVSAASADVTKEQDKLTKATDAVTAASTAETQAKAGVQKANDAVTVATEKATLSQEQLAATEAKLGGSHKMTAQDAITLQKAHDAVTAASDNLTAAENKVGDANTAVTKAADAVTAAQADQTAAQDALTLAQNGGVDKGARLALINADLTKAVGDQRGTATEMEVAQAKLNDAWEKFAVKVGPGVQKMFTELVTVAGELADGASILIDDTSSFVDWLENLTGPAATARDVLLAISTVGIAPLVQHFGEVIGAIQSLIAWFGSLVSEAEKDVKKITDAVKPLTDVLGGIGGLVGGVGGLIPKLAGGGVVTSPTLAMIGEGGEPEAVVPEHLWPALGGGKGGSTINMTINNPVPETPSVSAFHAGLMLTSLGYVPPTG